MKIYFTIFAFSFFEACSGQVDSAWMADYTRGFSIDTGLYLPAVNLIDEKGNKRTLAEFRGKVLYIDVWTTWCDNCIIRFPHAKKLHDRLASIHLDTAIQFINICSEESKSDWKKALKKYQPKGINLYAKDTLFYETWKIEAFPRYIIVDRDGRIMSLNGPGVDEGSVDYVLYAATKGVKSSVAAMTDFRQNDYFLKHQRFTNDPEGIDYESWYNATVKQRYEYWRERNEQYKKERRQ
jgi:thiol-disulfide isomerase/thioredoxin